MSQIYFEKLFKNKEIYWKCLYLMPCCVTVDTNLHIFQHKILINVIRQKKKMKMKNFLNLKLFLYCFLLFVIQKMKLLYTIFTLAIKQNLLGLQNSEILFPQNMPQSAFFGFPDKKILKSLTIYILYFLSVILFV